MVAEGLLNLRHLASVTVAASADQKNRGAALNTLPLKRFFNGITDVTIVK